MLTRQFQQSSGSTNVADVSKQTMHFDDWSETRNYQNLDFYKIVVHINKHFIQ